MRNELDIVLIRDFIANTSNDTRIYLGCDSIRYKRLDKDTGKLVWYARYATAVVIHYDGKHGAKVFGATSTERDFDSKAHRPNLRMMNEAYKLSSLYSELEDIIGEREVELHLDINVNPMHGSNCAMKEALGYIRGMHNLEPKFKPQAWAASCCADWLLHNGA